MKKIIVTADDFGMCQSVDDAIIDLINGKTLSSTNIITNMGNLQNVNKLKQLKDQKSHLFAILLHYLERELFLGILLEDLILHIQKIHL